MTEATEIERSFHADGWITASIEGVRALGYKTERLTVHLTNLAATGLPENKRDWRITYTDAETGQTHAHVQPTNETWTDINDAIACLPAYQLVCRTCGSDDVVADAVARWDADNACWDLSSTFDDRNCCSCNAEGSSILKEILPSPNLLTADASA